MTDKSLEKHICSHKHAFFLDNIVRMLFQSPRKLLGNYIVPGQTIIDLGCGPGFFTLAMAEMVGPEGRIVGVDLQPEMLAKVKYKSEKIGLEKRIMLHQCGVESIGLDPELQADFILVFYMLHEVRHPQTLFVEMKGLLKKDGRILIVEPPFHVSKKDFSSLIKLAQKTGFKVIDYPKKKGGRSVLLSH